MFKLILCLILLNSILPTYGVETTGHLTLLNKGGQLIVGETYRAKLILAPFDKRLLIRDQIENQRFLDFFYVANLKKISVSPNNIDATEVKLDLVLIKKFDPREFYIFQLGDRNIPIQLKNFVIQNVDLNIKDFLIMENTVNQTEGSFWRWLWPMVLFFLLISVSIWWKFFRKPDKAKYQGVAIGDLQKIKTHGDLEDVYRNREGYYKILSNVEREELEGVILAYATEQFKKEWRERDISDFCKKINTIGKDKHHGV